jgi:hypothetical protein
MPCGTRDIYMFYLNMYVSHVGVFTCIEVNTQTILGLCSKLMSIVAEVPRLIRGHYKCNRITK